MQHVTGLTEGPEIDFRLEEAQRVGDNQWELVISFLTENKNPILGTKVNLFDLGAKLSSTQFERVFKKVLISDEGELLKLSRYNN